MILDFCLPSSFYTASSTQFSLMLVMLSREPLKIMWQKASLWLKPNNVKEELNDVSHKQSRESSKKRPKQFEDDRRSKRARSV